MNRLILLGNGFDLAHGLKTGYNDFILWYLKQSFQEAYDNLNYEDTLVSIIKGNWREDLRIGNIINGVSAYIDYYYKNGFDGLIYNKNLDIQHTTYRPFFEVKIKSKFLEYLLNKCDYVNWVDIENEYFKELKKLFNLSVETKFKEDSLNNLNKSLKSIIEFLSKYLQSLPAPNVDRKYLELFEEKILKEDVVIAQLNHDTIPISTYVLNFNYTSTIENYLKSNFPLYSKFEFEVNYIHGQLSHCDNPLIFGFGDELDEDYLKMELGKNKVFLEYIKSFWYFKTSNYHNLIRFIDSDDFQIFILGHSCGLSDRTMLNMIFEHNNCKSIKIFYHEKKDGSNNFTHLTQEISKHFKDKGMMRKKIVPFDKLWSMPQLQ